MTEVLALQLQTTNKSGLQSLHLSELRLSYTRTVPSVLINTHLKIRSTLERKKAFLPGLDYSSTSLSLLYLRHFLFCFHSLSLF